MTASGRSSLERSKTESYLGFARRAGKLTLGINGTAASKKVFLLVADEGASENSKKEIQKLRARFSCPLVWVDGLGGMVGKEGCRLAAVRDRGLAAAIGREHPEALQEEERP